MDQNSKFSCVNMSNSPITTWEKRAKSLPHKNSKTWDLSSIKKKSKFEYLGNIDSSSNPITNNQMIDRDKVYKLSKNVELNNVSKRTTLRRFFVTHNLANSQDARNRRREERSRFLTTESEILSLANDGQKGPVKKGGSQDDISNIFFLNKNQIGMRLDIVTREVKMFDVLRKGII